MKNYWLATLIVCFAASGLSNDLVRIAFDNPSEFSAMNAAFAADSLATPGTLSSPTPAPPATLPTEDYTERLKMSPGMTMLFPVTDGCDRNGRAVPNYTMAVQFEPKSKDCAFSYKWTMAGLNASGIRAVDQNSKLASRKISLFYKPGETCALLGYTSAIRISDAMYRDLKSGVSSALELDGPFVQSVRHASAVPLPQNIAKVAEEDLAIQVDEKKVKVHTLKAVGDNPAAAFGPFQNGGWTYWILDNPNFPVILKGSGPFNWDNVIINSNGTIGDGSNNSSPSSTSAGTKEGKRIVQDLKKNGIASTNAILFDFDSDKLKPSAKPILNEISTYLKQNASVKIAVQGHCDNVGGNEYNLKLSKRRAKSVMQFLINQSIGSERLQSEGYGYTKPVASNKTAAGRAKNRRVVFKVLEK